MRTSVTLDAQANCVKVLIEAENDLEQKVLDLVPAGPEVKAICFARDTKMVSREFTILLRG